MSERVTAAQDIGLETDWNTIVPPAIAKLVDMCSNGLGTTREAFFYPLISAAAAMLGKNACIALNDFWPEPPIIWTALIVDDTCRKKSAVQRYIVGAIREVEEQLASYHPTPQLFDNAPDNILRQSSATMLISDLEFSLARLAERVRENKECFLFSKDLHKVHHELDVSRDSKEQDALKKIKDRDAFFDLHSGQSPWTDDSDNYYSDARFNITGFLNQKDILPRINESAAFSGFLETTVAIACPVNRRVFHNQLVGANGPLLAPIFLKLRQDHDNLRVYTLDSGADAAFASYYNEVEEKLDQMASDDRPLRRILSKSQGQVARLALVMHCLNQSAGTIFTQQGQMVLKNETPEFVQTKISASIVNNAVSLIRLCIRHKVALLTPSVAICKGVASGKSTYVPKSASVQKPSPATAETRNNMEHNRRLVDVVRPQTYVSATNQGPTAPVISPAISNRLVSRRDGTNRVVAGVGPHTQSVRQQRLPLQQQVPVETLPTRPSTAQTLVRQPLSVPVQMSMAPGDPQIVQVSYTPPGSSIPVSVHSRAVATSESVSRDNRQGIILQRTNMSRPLPKLLPRQRVGNFSMPPRPLSRSSQALARSVARRARRKGAYQTVTSIHKYPTSMDFENFVERYPRNAMRVLTNGKKQLEASYVAQRKLAPPLAVGIVVTPGKKPNRFPTPVARAFLTALADAGLGEMISRSGSRSGKSALRKHDYKDLSPAAKDMLVKLNVTEEEFMFVNPNI
ncbi:uncharacterized protein [Diadema antillarum]|uniref:uncharacterized protein n=1 Tax=Diadema antillarum TaxID=105358 RepID=UPI003A864FE6